MSRNNRFALAAVIAAPIYLVVYVGGLEIANHVNPYSHLNVSFVLAVAAGLLGGLVGGTVVLRRTKPRKENR